MDAYMLIYLIGTSGMFFLLAWKVEHRTAREALIVIWPVPVGWALAVVFFGPLSTVFGDFRPVIQVGVGVVLVLTLAVGLVRRRSKTLRSGSATH